MTRLMLTKNTKYTGHSVIVFELDLHIKRITRGISGTYKSGSTSFVLILLSTALVLSTHKSGP